MAKCKHCGGKAKFITHTGTHLCATTSSGCPAVKAKLSASVKRVTDLKEPCETCGREFSPHVLAKHESVCEPKFCKNCDTRIFGYRVFCGHSCSAIYNNLQKEKLLPKHSCIYCGVLTFNELFCDTECAGLEKSYQRRLKLFREGSIAREDLFDKQKGRCAICKRSKWLDGLIPLELDHIDGNSENENRKNLRLICPNCHAQTPTYKGRNVGQGRHKRRQRYAEGKSY